MGQYLKMLKAQQLAAENAEQPRASTGLSQRSSSSVALSAAGSMSLRSRQKTGGAASVGSKPKTAASRLSQRKPYITQEGIDLEVYIKDGILGRSKTTCPMFAVRHNDKRPVYWYNEVPQA